MGMTPCIEGQQARPMWGTPQAHRCDTRTEDITLRPPVSPYTSISTSLTQDFTMYNTMYKILFVDYTDNDLISVGNCQERRRLGGRLGCLADDATCSHVQIKRCGKWVMARSSKN